MRDLAAAAGLSFSTIAKIESGTVPRDATASAIVQALARHNVEIINGDGTGARLRFQKR
ncbi:helix-turn-helix domain-containing protein [Salaquimonas pukyongi]|uniref:helix-turn-helix domain-containing protein n=1 Tax=Salaquimonas pukyongi TaxID=2712698 RepID=UPI001FCE05F8|nr:helix-turn-helix domain-containing protein [Salaquimonas pukyongi]